VARKKTTKTADTSVVDYRHETTRKNIPPAGLAAQGKVREVPKVEYAYNPHLPPVLRFDSEGEADKLPELLQTARTRQLTAEEAQTLADALRNQEPWLEWAGKREKKGFEVDPVALHIHERISTQAILKVASREDVQRDLFADPQQEYREAVQFYQHDVDWTNRMILGDSLQVMASLARREDLAGKVQMIYLDPPYGIKFASNFQPEINNRDVKDRESDLTREAETVKAYRDTWKLGVHSYLAYLRERLTIARELLTDSGSIFVQIGDENVHRVRILMDEVFGADNVVTTICVTKTSGLGAAMLSTVVDYILWYAKDIEKAKYRQLYRMKSFGQEGAEEYTAVELPSGERRTMSVSEKRDETLLPNGSRVYRLDNLTSQSRSQTTVFNYSWEGKTLGPGAGGWKTNLQGMNRLAGAHRIKTRQIGNTITYVRYLDDFPAIPISNIWTDVSSGFNVYQPKIYVVQTNERIIERCLLMTTDPGDLVLDPTCGSGTTAEVAEQWGRRWVTIDTSRVAISLARQRLLGASFPLYKVKGNETDNPASGFIYKTVPHITLRSIAQNVALDSIVAKYKDVLAENLRLLNKALRSVTPEVRQRLKTKLVEKQRREGAKSVSEEVRRRLILPNEDWAEWVVPFGTDEDWTSELKSALEEYRAAWRAKMDEVSAAIAANAEQEELVDQAEILRNVVRVSGPFTVEAVMPAEESLEMESPIEHDLGNLETFGDGVESPNVSAATLNEPANADAYLDRMLRLLQSDGVRFPNNKVMKFTRLEPSIGGEYLHAEGEWQAEDGATRSVAISFGPQFGSITAFQVENALPMAARRGYEDLVFAGFSFDATAQATIQDDPNPRVRCHLAHIRPDVNMGDLLKETPNSQIFTVFGSPRTELRPSDDGMFEVEMQGVDIYNPVDNTIVPTQADKVAAWFVDTDYDGRTFCITQAFFPNKSAWEKLQRALKGVIDEAQFDRLTGTVSLPFATGKHNRVAVKVIDPRGNEVMRVHRLTDNKGGR
jgi:adenine-specific DNA-methyltransferase